MHLYDTWLRHDRFAPTPHGFSYRLLLLAIDLAAAGTGNWLFGRNRQALLALRDRDHLDGSGRPLETQVAEILAAHGIEHDGGRILLLCQPRLLGHVFNPISVYYVHRRDGSLQAVLYEVNNTFGERHSYLFPVEADAGDTLRHGCEKMFHVSPFMSLDLAYDFRVTTPNGAVRLDIDVRQGETPMLTARLAGKERPFTAGMVLKLLAAGRLFPLKVLGAIHWEAIRLFRKRVGFWRAPTPPAQAVTMTRREA
ncbi:DUF1365 domain-containing protein [Sphingoaurantiacus capsulatus]|uniref:DUF1365 domain-containing protein n=1 Tax=Sphingoaurantiacus capsulatus TaxID=1771310 RepID=A0ABV7X6F9_9SPHN